MGIHTPLNVDINICVTGLARGSSRRRVVQ